MVRALLLATGLFVALIGALLMVAPQAYFQFYATEYVSGMDFPARRFSPALLALGALLIMARSLESGPFLSRLCLLTGLAFLAVAATGVHDWASGIARPAILGAAGLEVAVGVVFLWSAHRMKRA
ncbi:hypothetical protein [Marivita geojedonensis]|uniref:DUF4345 domain-containing protein n=1 Tax=Marivita geojedonensis TaxID=1123756 RepID=A0A1X4NLU3_9RHOB|nr:hypothetical protein [Marivita geojedonensis]OSQ51259.1 hypothetical protein MGEO_09380 [Marivita geojedonensis]PRY78469.1 hypothetical protein CLV76_10627 [Marivita geojedonensis]